VTPQGGEANNAEKFTNTAIANESISAISRMT
jgi:hypothetical protein